MGKHAGPAEVEVTVFCCADIGATFCRAETNHFPLNRRRVIHSMTSQAFLGFFIVVDLANRRFKSFDCAESFVVAGLLSMLSNCS